MRGFAGCWARSLEHWPRCGIGSCFAGLQAGARPNPSRSISSSSSGCFSPPRFTWLRNSARTTRRILESSLSPAERALGSAFGPEPNVVMTLALMTLSAAARSSGPRTGKINALPVDRWPLDAYRFIETRLAGIGPSDPAHTPLPTLSETAPKTPADFWR